MTSWLRSSRSSVALRVVIPVNRLDRAKGRLAELLTPGEREQLALATLDTVLRAVNEAGFEPVVLSADESLGERLEKQTTIVAESPEASGLNGQLEALLGTFHGEDVLILHADLPLASARALRNLVEAAPRSPSCTLVRSLDGGTNAMLVSRAGGFALAYGAGSFAKHEAAARAAGYAVHEFTDDALSLDLDTPADLRILLESEAGRASAAGRLLASLDVASRLNR